MPGYEQTNVRLPLCALNALAVVMDRRGISRDEAVRQVVGEHVERQENREPEDRLSHISTILRYPAPPRWPGDPREVYLGWADPAREYYRGRFTVFLRAKSVLFGQHADQQKIQEMKGAYTTGSYVAIRISGSEGAAHAKAAARVVKR